jgi:hypothetical protein
MEGFEVIAVKKRLFYGYAVSEMEIGLPLEKVRSRRDVSAHIGQS